jgi:hypothetical protein
MAKSFPSERAYLASLSPPLAKAGSRGRFSKEAHAALAKARDEGVTFDGEADAEGNASPPVTQVAGGAPSRSESFLARPAVKQPRRRQEKVLYGYTSEGYKVGFSTCRRCTLHMQLCACPQGIQPPSIVETIDADSLSMIEYQQEVLHGKNDERTENRQPSG